MKILIGCLLIGGALICFLPVISSLWFSNIKADAVQHQAIKAFSEQLATPSAPASSGAPPATMVPLDYGPPKVGVTPDYFETFGIIYIPRFGSDYSRPIVQGTGLDVLDNLGLGHYENTAMPGEIGNFAIAGHRQTHGAVLDKIHLLEPGDKIYVQTKEGFYAYVFRNTQIVLPDAADVLAPVPMDTKASPTERILTMTSCNPQFGSQERIIAYSTMESWQPLSAGPPAEIANAVEKAKN
jgi:sortase A